MVAGAGGLVAVLGPVLERLGGTWMFAPASDEDYELARTGTPLEYGSATLRIVNLPREAHRDHYATVSSELLSRLFHYMFELAREPTFDDGFKEAWSRYRAVNEIYGEAVRAHAQGDCDGVLIDDMHLMLVAASVRANGGVDVPLSYFHHVPWCGPEYFAVLPSVVRTEILAGMLAHDVVGFHSRRWLDAFVACCERFLKNTRSAGDRIEWGGQSTRLLIAPAAIDVRLTLERAASGHAKEWRSRHEQFADGRRAVVRVERADPSKNTLRGIDAYRLLLERTPELIDEACLLAVLSPVRGWIKQYRDYVQACVVAAESVNRSIGRPVVRLDLEPDTLRSDHYRALAALSLADVLCVTPTIDGLNLVAMEGAIVGEPALVLSESAGVHDLLGAHALTVNPFDVAETSDQLLLALQDPEGERRRCAVALRSTVTDRDPEEWVRMRLTACV
jgi:trehalose 6-phosphate synthase